MRDRTRWAAALLAMALGGCGLRLNLTPERPPLDPPASRMAGAVGLSVPPHVGASNLEFYNRYAPPIPAPVAFVVPIGAEVADAWERLLRQRFDRVERVIGAPPPGLVGVVELTRAEAVANADLTTYRLEVEVSAVLRDGAGQPVETIVVRGRSVSEATTVPGGLDEAAGLAVKQAAELFQGELDRRPAARGWMGATATPTSTPYRTTPITAPIATAPEDLPGTTPASSLFLFDAGWTGQANRGSASALELTFGGLVQPGRLSAGGLGRIGARGDLLSWSVAAVGGGMLRPEGAGPRVDLLGELGLLGLVRSGHNSFLVSQRDVSGGNSTLPYLGLRLHLGMGRGGTRTIVGLWAQRTLGTATEPYSVRNCTLFVCTQDARVAHDGGFALGLTVGLGVPGRVGRPAERPHQAADR